MYNSQIGLQRKLAINRFIILIWKPFVNNRPVTVSKHFVKTEIVLKITDHKNIRQQSAAKNSFNI